MSEDRIGRNGAAARTDRTDMNEHGHLREGDIVELTVRGERRTAEVMLVSMDDATSGTVLLDLFDGDRPAWARLSSLQDVVVYRPDLADVLVAA
jgi:hypothetical protein